MGSINEFAFQEERQRRAPQGRPPRRPSRLLGQVVVSLILFVAVWQLAPTQGVLGQYARRLCQEGLAPANSWLDLEEVLPVFQGEAAVPTFVLPLSGVVVRDFALQRDDAEAQATVIIRGEVGQSVQCAADGQVTFVSQVDGLYRVEVSHAQGFRSVYSGLQEATVRQKDDVRAGQVLGTVGESPLSFSLWQDDRPQDPLLWLFMPENVV